MINLDFRAHNREKKSSKAHFPCFYDFIRLLRNVWNEGFGGEREGGGSEGYREIKYTSLYLLFGYYDGREEQFFYII